ncbi:MULTISPECIES: GNAT family N-acetyltransferase [unclassified Marinovum]
MKPAPQSDLRTEVIDRFEALDRLRAGWEHLARIDPHAGFFLSWDWMNSLLTDNPGTWHVLVVRGGDPQDIVAILPLRHAFHWSESSAACQTRYEAAGRLGLSDATGFLCDPDREEAAIEALAQQLTRLPWKRISLRYVAAPHRAVLFAKAFEDDGFRVDWPTYTGNTSTTDQLRVPSVALPDSFEGYLQGVVSKSTRSKIRRFRRRYLDDGPYRITLTTPQTFDASADILQRLWRARWGETLSGQAMRRYQTKQRALLQRCESRRALFMPVLWRAEQPIGVLARLVDRPGRVMKGLIAARDHRDDLPCIGLLLNAFCIEAAIGMGVTRYELGHGNEPYKYQYGAVDTHLAYLTIRRRGGAAQDIFSPASVAPAARLARDRLAQGAADQTSEILRQIEAVSL